MAQAKRAKKRTQVDPTVAGHQATVAELQAIKRLLMVFMAQAGLSQVDLAKVVDVDQGTVSKMLKGTGKKRISFRVESVDEEED